jgi:tetratricopeptide (TPR) repeat protein
MTNANFLWQATKAERQDRFDEAVNLYKQAIAADPSHVEAYLRLGELLDRSGYAFAALDAYQRALALKPDDMRLLNRATRSALTCLDLDAAGEMLQRMLALRPHHPDGLMLAGELSELQGKLDQAEARYRPLAAAPTRHHGAVQGLERLRRVKITLAETAERYRAALADDAPPAGSPEQTHFVTFGTASYRERQDFVARTAVAFAAVDRVVNWAADRLAALPAAVQHRAILGERTGAGFFLWKPMIILDRLSRVRDGDWVVYSDVGSAIPYPIYHRLDALKAWAVAANGGIFPGIYIPDCGPNRRWTRRDCFVRMGCDRAEFWDRAQIQASFSLWRKSPAALDFVREWLDFCADRAVVSDDANLCGLPNLEGFVAHRHDQSVITNLARLRGIVAFGDPERPLACHQSLKRIDFVAANFDALARKPASRPAERS